MSDTEPASSSSNLPEEMRAWRVHAWGPSPVETLQLDTVPRPEPEAGELLVRVQAIPLNLNDLERVNGENMMVRPELPLIPGMEVMGEVVGAGPGLEDAVGRRVVAMPKQAHGGFAEYAVCPAVSAFDMPAAIPLPDAAALYFPFHLAWLGLVDRADLQAGESVLIHAGAGGAGSAAIQLAKHLGARVYATAGTDEKVALCRELGADVALNYNDTDFHTEILADTQNAGVDVVFDSVGDSVVENSMRCIGYNGRYLMMGFASDKRFADEKWIVPRRLSTGNFKLCGVLLAYGDEHFIPAMKQAMGWNFCPHPLGAQITQEVAQLVINGKLKPVIGDVVAFDALPAALERLRDRATTGRILITLDAS